MFLISIVHKPIKGTILLESSRRGENKEERSVRRRVYEDRKF